MAVKRKDYGDSCPACSFRAKMCYFERQTDCKQSSSGQVPEGPLQTKADAFDGLLVIRNRSGSTYPESNTCIPERQQQPMPVRGLSLTLKDIGVLTVLVIRPDIKRSWLITSPCQPLELLSCTRKCSPRFNFFFLIKSN